ncbi:aspartate:alanine exchanger family transporter [Corynebacterium cystitidis]|uniref:aspartate:alanine exchanger family transporter n=1 Tax=Corynebacterium cystitidis TaxID=35757 RepID=UPI00211E537C|nr:TrkA C-terminal domain-containing protein [Corynebacterium cystitidis]
MLQALAENQVLLLALLVGLGMLVARLRIKGISLGAAAVLFVSLIVTAYASTQGVELQLSHDISTLGLVLFAFAIGITSGPNFFHTLRTSLGELAGYVVILVLTAGVALGVGRLLGLDIATIAGTFAGALTNTPALSAAGTSSGDVAAATVGYAIAYIFGVLGMLIFALVALSKAKSDTDAPDPVLNRTIEVERTDRPVVEDVQNYVGSEMVFSRIQHGAGGTIEIPHVHTPLDYGDLVTIVGTEHQMHQAIEYLGKPSKRSLMLDRKDLDFRRMTLSNSKLAGKTVREIDAEIDERFGAYTSRIRRGDTDKVAEQAEKLQLGDRVRIVAPHENMKDIAHYFGDSSRGLTDINPVALGLGLALGIFLGTIAIPMPGGGTFSIGAAAGALLVGLVFGRIGRIGGFVTALPQTTCAVLSELGLLIFLAAAGTTAGARILNAFAGGAWLSILILGAIITATYGLGLFVMMRYLFRMGGTKLSGFLAGAQTQPAVLAFSNDRTGSDPRVALGYAMVYPVAMIAKILTAQILGGF